MVSQIKVDNILESTSGAGVSIAGHVLQVVSGTDASAVNITSTSMTDTGLSASITPSATSSKILVLINHNVFCWAPGAIPYAYFEVLRDSTNISGDSSYGIAFGKKAYLHGDSNNYRAGTLLFNHLDSPSTTSAITYKTRAKYAGSGSGYVRTAYADQVDSLVLMEIGG